MTANMQRQRYRTLAAFSKGWWSTWRRRALAGETVGPMVDLARRGRAWQVMAEEAVADPALVAVRVESDAFRRWSVWFAELGISLPRPSRCPVAWLPAEDPPDG